MKKLLYLFIPLLFISCSGDDNEESIDSLPIVGTYSFVYGCDSHCEEDLFYSYDCPTDYLEFTDSLFLIGFTDNDDCSNTEYYEEYSVSYEITKNNFEEIQGKLNFNELDTDSSYDYFVFLTKQKLLFRFIVTDNREDREAYQSTWDIKEVWQKN